jgi:YidC/Oxa1 family membrane protein insertase
MEKRLIIALVLSIIVLYLWPGMIPSQRAERDSLNMSQHYGNNMVETTEERNSNVSLESAESKSMKFSEEIKRLESDKIIVEFSNIGGSIKRVTLKEYDFTFPLTGIGAVSGYETATYSLDNFNKNEAVYLYSDDDVKIYKSYIISDNDYTISTNTKVIKIKDAFRLDNIGISGFIVDMSNLNTKNANKKKTYDHDKSLLEYVVSSYGEIYRKNNAHQFSTKEKIRKETDVNWIGFRSRYFCAILKPLYKASRYTIEYITNDKLMINIGVDNAGHALKNIIEFPSILFVGPEETDLLQSYKMGFEDIKRYYKWTLFDSIAKIIHSIMYNINKIVPNWGICIIIISVIVYFSMYPLTLRSMSSMKKMQALQPKISVLREKYKENPQKMNMETMELYKKHKINPLGGCLPMLLQMPVFIGLYQVLWRSVSLKGAHFLWIKDLSEPDRLFVFNQSIPFIGNELNVLPIIMIFVMAFQQKLTSKNMVTSDPAQIAQQKMMAVIMPIFLGYMFYKFSSGLTLYFTMFYMFSTFTQWRMSVNKEVVS